MTNINRRGFLKLAAGAAGYLSLPAMLKKVLAGPEPLCIGLGYKVFDDGITQKFSEISGNGYARAEIPQHVANHETRFVDVIFPEASGNWGTITHVMLQKGDKYFWSAVDVPHGVIAGDTVHLDCDELLRTVIFDER